MTADPTRTVRALAKHYRTWAARDENTIEWPALAELFDGIAERHQDPPQPFNGYCDWCNSEERLIEWPCPDMKAALAVAAALGIEA